MGVPSSGGSAAAYGARSQGTEGMLEAMDKNRDGAVSRSEFKS